jgi:serine/threonine protein kinase
MAVKKFESAFAIYTTQEIIGEGGSGVVYKALDENSNIVAVKCLDLKKSTKEKQKRFRNEINFCLRNTHKNIVTITDYGVHAQGKENTMFYVMPYYPSTLRKLMDNKIKPEKALIYFSQILDGLEAAHLKSVWHRDLKPENILYDPLRDILVLADFGIAHFGEEFLKTSIETKKNTRLANFRYAAPEQRGSGEKVDQRTDLFSLGMILYEMYTGLLLQGTGHKRVGEVLPEYSYLDNLIENLTRQSPANRPVSIDEVKKNLIGHENDYISRQRLDQLSKTVVPETEISDPLVINPIAILEVDYQNGSLIFF